MRGVTRIFVRTKEGDNQKYYTIYIYIHGYKLSLKFKLTKICTRLCIMFATNDRYIK